MTRPEDFSLPSALATFDGAPARMRSRLRAWGVWVAASCGVKVATSRRVAAAQKMREAIQTWRDACAVEERWERLDQECELLYARTLDTERRDQIEEREGFR